MNLDEFKKISDQNTKSECHSFITESIISLNNVPEGNVEVLIRMVCISFIKLECTINDNEPIDLKGLLNTCR